MNFDVDCFVSIYAGTSSSWFNSKENPRMRIFLYNKSVLFTRISPHVRFTSRYLLINSVLRQAYSRFESARIWSWLHCPCSNQGRPRCSSWTDRISEFTVKINFFCLIKHSLLWRHSGFRKWNVTKTNLSSNCRFFVENHWKESKECNSCFNTL